jgi:DUF971 family protein
MNTQPWPNELRVSADKATLTVVFEDDQSFELPAEMLRVLSPSAEVQGHSPEQRTTVGGKRNVRIARMVPTGNYAVRVVFDDGHDTGIFTWAYLRRLGMERERLWVDYLKELDAKGLQR